jgi:hypothetical protein
MIYSVWNQGRGLYDYFQDAVVQEGANAPKPAHLKSRQLGLTPDQAAWPLPAGAKKIGSGEFARGRVASPTGGQSLGLFGIESVFDIRAIALGVAAWFLWRAHKRGDF